MAAFSRIAASAAVAAATWAGTAHASVTAKQLLHLNNPEGYGAMFTSAGLSVHDSGVTAAFAQYLNAPILVQAFNESSQGAPIWQLYPPDNSPTNVFYSVDSARYVNKSGMVDTVAMLSDWDYAQTCTLYGLFSTGPKAPGVPATPAWSVTWPACIDGGEDQQFRYVDMSDDGTLVAVQLFLNGTAGAREMWLFVLDGQTGRSVWKQQQPLNAGGYGAQLTDSGQWLLTSVDESTTSVNRTSFVYDARTGRLRGSFSLFWNVPSAISNDGNLAIGGSQDALLFYNWSGAAYVPLAPLNAPPLNQQGWVPMDMVISTFTDPVTKKLRHIAGSTWITLSEAVGRFIAFDLDAAAAGEQDVIVTDSQLDNNAATGQTAFCYVRAAGPYFFVGTNGGSVGGPLQPSQYLFKAGTDKALWTYTSEGSVNGLEVVLASSTKAADVLHVAAAGPANPGGDGNGGDAYWWQVTVTNN